MNLGNVELERDFEIAVAFLCQVMPVGEERKKPLLMHALRVGMYLFSHGYSRDIVIGGLLHDGLEWSDASEETIRKQFGDRVMEIVEANTKDRTMTDPVARRREYIDHCVQTGEDALIVKIADTLDSYRFYQAIGNSEELARSIDIAKIILEKRPPHFHDKIFKELEQAASF